MDIKTKKIIIYLSLIAVAGIILSNIWHINSLQTKVEELESDVMLEEFTDNVLEDRGNTCLQNVYDDYSKAWDKACFSNGEKGDCILPLIDRIDLTMDYNSGRVECLISVN